MVFIENSFGTTVFRYFSSVVRGNRLCAIALLLIGIHKPSLTAEAPWKERLLKEAPKALQDLAEFNSRLQGRLCITRTIKETRKTQSETDLREIDFLINQQWAWMKETSSVHGINSRYSFDLIKRDGSPKWTLANFRGSSLGKYYESVGEVLFYVHAPWAVEANPLSERLRLIKPESLHFEKPNYRFRLQEVRGFVKDGKSYVSVAYEEESVFVVPTSPDKKNRAISQTTVVLDPKEYWCIQGYKHRERRQLSGNKTVNVAVTLHYGNTIEGYPMVKRMTMSSQDDEGSYLTNTTCDFTKLIHRAAPESEFTLPAFGISNVPVPSPTGAASAPARSPTAEWSIALGLFLFVVLGVTWFLRRRRPAVTAT